MSMSRRGFLRALAFAVPAAFVVPDVVKTIFLPAADAPVDWWKQYVVTAEPVEDNLYLAIGSKYARAMAESLLQTKRMVMARVLEDTVTHGFGMAQLKPEGGSIAFDHIPMERLRQGRCGLWLPAERLPTADQLLKQLDPFTS